MWVVARGGRRAGVADGMTSKSFAYRVALRYSGGMTDVERPSVAVMTATILGVSELPEFLGVQRTTVHVWGYRKQLPPPDFVSINGFKAWYRQTVIRWAAETGRLPVWLEAEGGPWVPAGGYKRPRRTKAEMAAAAVR